MSGYRFCRTDDIGLLVDALNRCGNDPPATAASFKRSIRDLQVWCSSCMVAFSGADPIGVLIGAKRASSTLIHTIAVHPDHRRQGHGRHLLDSLGSKLSILGPPRIVAEIPEAAAPACALFVACGYVAEAVLTDYVLHDAGPNVSPTAPLQDGNFVIPVTVDDLAANGLLGEGDAEVCWERSIETLAARKAEIQGLAVTSDERIEAYLLHRVRDDGRVEIVSLRSLADDGGARLAWLLGRIGAGPFHLPKVHPAEIPTALLATLRFRPAGGHVRYAARPRAD